jgi:hypothetical protein
MAATLGLALGLKKQKFWPLVLVLVALQACAMVWYALSYFPGGRAVAKTVILNPIRRS